MNKSILVILLCLYSTFIFGQSSSKIGKYFANPIIVDSSSTIMIPTLYDASLFSSSKFSLESFYSNITFYNFITDSTKRLFVNDTYIANFNDNDSYNYYRRDYDKKVLKNISKDWIFYFVKITDYNRGRKVDEKTPSVLFVSDKKGNNLKELTSRSENAKSIEIYEKQGLALIKIQRDMNNDREFDSDDTDFYYIRLDLKTLKLTTKIELK